MPTAEITLLAVENDRLQARILRHELLMLGYGLAGTARTADEAETLFDELRPDLVLLDVHLDGTRDGIETAALVARRQVPLIFITSFPDGPTFARARQVGPFAFLGKPYNGPLLGHSIELALQHFASAQGLPVGEGGASQPRARCCSTAFLCASSTASCGCPWFRCCCWRPTAATPTCAPLPASLPCG